MSTSTNEATPVATAENEAATAAAIPIPPVSNETVLPSVENGAVVSTNDTLASTSSRSSTFTNDTSSSTSINEALPPSDSSTPSPSTDQGRIAPSTINEVIPSPELQDEREGRPSTSSSSSVEGNGHEDRPSTSSSSGVDATILHDTPTSSEPSTPSMREITVLEGEGVERIVGREEVPNEVVEAVAVENITGVAEEGVLPAVEENAALTTEEGVGVVIDDVAPVAIPEEAARVAAEGNETAVAGGEEAAVPVENNAAALVENDPPVPGENDPAAPAPVENEAPPAEPARDDTAQPPQTETNDATPPEEAPAEPEPEPEPQWVYDPEKPTTILAIPPEIVLHTLDFLPLYNMKEFSLCSKRCHSLAIRRIFKHINITYDALKAFQKGGSLHHIADAVFGIVIRTRFLRTASALCTFMRECMYATREDGEEGGLGVFKAARRVKVSYGQIRYDRTSAVVNTGPLDSLSALDTRFIKAIFLSLRKLGFWKRIRWVDFVIKLWEDRHGVFDEPVEEGSEIKPEDKLSYLSEEEEKFLENILEFGRDDYDGVKDMVAVAPGLRDVRLIHFKPRRRVTYRRKVDIFEVLACMGGKPDKVVLEYISAGESIDLVPSGRMDEVRVQRGVEEIWVNMASFDVPGFMEEIGRRFVDLKSLLLVVTTAGGEGYLVPAKGVSAGWRRGVLEKMEKIKGLKTFMIPVRVGQEGENISTGRRKELGEVPKDIIERLAELVIYWIENGADGLEKVVFERKELEDEVDSAVGPGWVCRVRWENRRPKLEWTVENTSVGIST